MTRRRHNMPTTVPPCGHAAGFAAAWILLLLAAAGCSRPVSHRQVLDLASVPPESLNAAEFGTLSPIDTERMRVAYLARIRAAYLDEGRVPGEWTPLLRDLMGYARIDGDPEDEAPAELVEAMFFAIAQAKVAEPGWNELHFASGFVLGLFGFPPETAFAILDGWEWLEHDSTVGTDLGMSLDEGTFGYLWDLEHGMSGYSAAASFFRKPSSQAARNDQGVAIGVAAGRAAGGAAGDAEDVGAVVDGRSDTRCSVAR